MLLHPRGRQFVRLGVSRKTNDFRGRREAFFALEAVVHDLFGVLLLQKSRVFDHQIAPKVKSGDGVHDFGEVASQDLINRVQIEAVRPPHDDRCVVAVLVRLLTIKVLGAKGAKSPIELKKLVQARGDDRV